jgi:hypothetical protein
LQERKTTAWKALLILRKEKPVPLSSIGDGCNGAAYISTNKMHGFFKSMVNV